MVVRDGKFPADLAWSDVTPAWFYDQILHQLVGTSRYRRQRNHVQKTAGKRMRENRTT